MRKYEVVTKIRRIDDGEIFSINENGTYSLHMMKSEYPESLTFGYSLMRLLSDRDSFEIAETAHINI